MRKPRTRVTLSLPHDLVETIDAYTRELKATRSSLVEEWLRFGAAAHRRRKLDDEITAYYSSREPGEAREDDELALASSRAASELHIDERPVRARSRRR